VFRKLAYTTIISVISVNAEGNHLQFLWHMLAVTVAWPHLFSYLLKFFSLPTLSFSKVAIDHLFKIYSDYIYMTIIQQVEATATF
jgi:hypothetical protein